MKATPLLLVGLGICIAFRANVINIGGEGQIIAGALMATWWPLFFHTWPGWLLIPSTMIAGFLAGAAWGFVPGILKARLNVNEILSTIMLNAIALQLMNLLLQGPLMDPAGVAARTYLAQSAQLPPQVWLPRLVPRTLLHAGAIVAVVLAVVVYVFLWRTTIGYDIRAVGLNPDAARYSGINVPTFQALSLTLAGGFFGAGGSGGGHRRPASTPGGADQRLRVHGDRGGAAGQSPPDRAHPGLGALRRPPRGGDTMQRAVQVPSSLVDGPPGPGRSLRLGLGALVAAVGGPAADRRAERPGGSGMKSVFSLGVISGILNTMVALATPFLYAALGETIAQTSGVVNLGVDGIMLLSAFAAFYAALTTGSLWLGLLAAASWGLPWGC